MTLDEDDIDIADQWIRTPDRWREFDVVRSFEAAFAQWNGSAFAFAFASGRNALSACIHALALKPGDEVIVPGYTCVVVQNAFDYANVRTVFCDIELDTYGPDYCSLESRISPSTRAILIQHSYGLVCRDYERICNLARARGLKIIEDCAHVTGGRFRGKRVGTFGDVAFYSLEWSKVMTTVVGGVAVTDQPRLASRLREYLSECSVPSDEAVIRQLRTLILAFVRAKRSDDWWAEPLARFKYGTEETVPMPRSEVDGVRPVEYRSSMPAAAAAIAMNQLRKVDHYNATRRENAKMWGEWCQTYGYRSPLVVAESEPVFLRYPVLVDAGRKQDTNWARQEFQLQLGVWFQTHLHPSARVVKNCPRADRAVSECINFPCLLPPKWHRRHRTYA